MAIGLLVAMDEEIKDILCSMCNVTSQTIGKKRIYEGQLCNQHVVLSHTGVGKANAAMSVGILKAKYNVSSIIMTGLAGSTTSKLHIGDIVVCEKFVQYDVDSRPNFPRFVVPFTERALSFADSSLSDLAYLSAKKIKALPELAPYRLHSKKPNTTILKGLVGTADKFVSGPDVTRHITSSIQGEVSEELLCVEMEGAAAAFCCEELGIPFTAIKVISDCPFDADSVTDYHQFKKKIASPYCNLIVKGMLSHMPK